MSLLLDSNALVWWLNNDPRIAGVEARIESEDTVFVSLVSPWELMIAEALGRVRLPERFEDRLSKAELTLIPPTLTDARLATSLPPLHRDPFDRMLVAQALNRKATLVTSDRRLKAYGVSTLLL